MKSRCSASIASSTAGVAARVTRFDRPCDPSFTSPASSKNRRNPSLSRALGAIFSIYRELLPARLGLGDFSDPRKVAHAVCFLQQSPHIMLF